MAPITSAHLLALEVVTRMSSVASLLGSLFIVTTFLCFKAFRTSKTRLIFYATWANIITNVATLISTSALPRDSDHVAPLCEVQAFLLQWFMLADSFWVFCMAANVWYVFFRGQRDEKKLAALEKVYVVFAYGTPGIAPFVYLIHDHVAKYRIVGSATLWCWVRDDYEWMRIAFFYAPLWILAMLTMGIHIRVGLTIYKTKKDMRKIMEESRRAAAVAPTGLEMSQHPPYSPKTSILVTTDVSHRSHTVTPQNSQNSLTSFFSSRSVTAAHPSDDSNTAESLTPRSSTASPGRPQPLIPLNPNSPRRLRNPHAIGRYRATAYAAPLAGGLVATLPSPHIPTFQPAEHAAHLQRRKDTADMYSYFKVSLLLFVALVVVWVPSSINRVYHLINPDHHIYGLNLASAIVLPTQGFWNALIYAQATWKECKDEYAKMVSRLKGVAQGKNSSDEPPHGGAGKGRASADPKTDGLTTRNAREANSPTLMV